MKTEPFQDNLWDAQLVLKTYGKEAKVYKCDRIFKADNVSEAQEFLYLLEKHKDEIKDAKEEIAFSKKILSWEISEITEEYGYVSKEESFDVMAFLEATSVDINQFDEKYNYLCWPKADRSSLEPRFKQYHVYKFYERYMGEITNGYEIFLKLLPDLIPALEMAKITDDFYWHNHDVKFIYDYENAIESLRGEWAERQLKLRMMSENFLKSIGFTKIGPTELPSWYNIFEADPEVTTSKAYELVASEYVFKIYFTPKGMFGECRHNNEDQNYLDYFRIESVDSLIENIMSYAEARLNWVSMNCLFKRL